MMFRGAFGLLVFMAVAWAFSENRRAFPVKTVLVGMGLQLALGILLLKVPFCRLLFEGLNSVVLAVSEATRAGTTVVFGYLGGGGLPFDEKFPGASYVLAFQGLPLVLVMSALSSVLFFWKILPVVIGWISRFFEKTMGIGGAEALGLSANIFVGMVEAPLFVRPYVAQMTRSELFGIMTCGMATIAGTVMVLYAGIIGPVIPDALGHILTASLISAPAAVTIAKVMVPETKEVTRGEITAPQPATSTMDALTKGTLQGVELLLSIVAMLIVLVACVHLVNLILGYLLDVGQKPVTLQMILGRIMAPVVWLAGIEWSQAQTAGALMGTKTIVNEFVAYLDLSRLPAEALSERSRLIITYALCGFANPGSLGIMIGGLGGMAPERRGEIVSLGLKSILAGTLATLMTGCVVGLLIF